MLPVTIDMGMLMATIMHQASAGAVCIAAAWAMCEMGGWAVKLILAADAYSVLSAVTAQMVKIPAERRLLSHVQYLHELLDHGILDYLP